MAEATRIFKVGHIELGGNDAALLLEDVALDEEAAANLMLGAFSTSGRSASRWSGSASIAVSKVLTSRSRRGRVGAASCAGRGWGG